MTGEVTGDVTGEITAVLVPQSPQDWITVLGSEFPDHRLSGCHPSRSCRAFHAKAAPRWGSGFPTHGGHCSHCPGQKAMGCFPSSTPCASPSSCPSPLASLQHPSPETGMSLTLLQLVIVTSCSQSRHHPSQGREELWGYLCALPRLHFSTTRLPSSARKLSFPNTY